MDLSKPGVRALGVAESYRGSSDGERDDDSVLAGVVMRADGRVEGFEFGRATVGGLDVTESVARIYDDLGREDVGAVMVSGLALAWYNIVDLDALHRRTDLPVVCVTYEESEGLDEAIEREFEGEEAEKRLELYRRQKERRRVVLQTGETVFVRSSGTEGDESVRLVEKFTTHGKKPEPLRVARLAARGVVDWSEK
ncbi:MAG: DUF99 family protein [Halobacteria archaeon]|nr:DUF99 family protein [Halobacteria archaeon]